MRSVKAAGIILFTSGVRKKFLVLKHPTRYDIPKGILKDGETERDAALRELEDETGISRDLVTVEGGFHFATSYQTRARRLGNQIINKELQVLLGFVKEAMEIKLAEHCGYEWIEWNPPHNIQVNTIDPLLDQIDKYLYKKSLMLINSQL